MKKIRLILLSPLGAIYGAISLLRRKLYKKEGKRFLPSTVPTICIGNLAVGGTGKTPHTEYLLQCLSSDHKVATLSRGYGRKTRGYVEAHAESTAEQVGDEPLQMKRKFPNVTVAVCEKRVAGLQKLLSGSNPPEVVLLDDAYQHLAVKCSLQILLTDYASMYCDDFPMPAGNLREFRCAASEADIVIVTKCPENLGKEEAEKIRKRLKVGAAQRCFFTTLQYGEPAPLNAAAEGNTLSSKNDIVFVSGIAHPEHAYRYLTTQFSDVKSVEFRDHHNFSKLEIDLLCKKIAESKRKKVLFFTEKDAARLYGTKEWERLAEIPVYSLPIQVKFLWDEGKFQAIIAELCGKK